MSRLPSPSREENARTVRHLCASGTPARCRPPLGGGLRPRPPGNDRGVPDEEIQMRYTTLGRTDLEVSRVCFGTWQFGGDWGSLEERENVAAMRRALELGINYFDTAQAYGFGASEQLGARARGDHLRTRRDELTLANDGGLR